MESTALDQTRHVPWNKGRLTGQKPPLKLNEIWAIRTRLQLTTNVRELALRAFAGAKGPRVGSRLWRRQALAWVDRRPRPANSRQPALRLWPAGVAPTFCRSDFSEGRP